MHVPYSTNFFKKKKTGDKIFMAKTRSNTGEKGSRNTWIFMFIIILALIDTNFVAYFVPISTSTPLACTFKKLYSLARNSGYPNKITFRK